MGRMDTAPSGGHEVEEDEALPHELQKPITLNSVNSRDGDPKENSQSLEGANCQVQPTQKIPVLKQMVFLER